MTSALVKKTVLLYMLFVVSFIWLEHDLWHRYRSLCIKVINIEKAYKHDANVVKNGVSQEKIKPPAIGELLAELLDGSKKYNFYVKNIKLDRSGFVMVAMYGTLSNFLLLGNKLMSRSMPIAINSLTIRPEQDRLLFSIKFLMEHSDGK